MASSVPLLARYEQLALSVPEDALGLVRALCDDVAREEPRSKLHCDALLLWYRRATDVRAFSEAHDAAIESLVVAGALGDVTLCCRAQRALAGALLNSGKEPEAFWALDRVTAIPNTIWFGASVFHPGFRSPLEKARYEAAEVAWWATPTTPEWVRAIGGLAEQHVEAKTALAAPLWQRYEALLDEVVSESQYVEEDLAVVIRQAEERGLRLAAAAAANVAARRVGAPERFLPVVRFKHDPRPPVERFETSARRLIRFRELDAPEEYIEKEVGICRFHWSNLVCCPEGRGYAYPHDILELAHELFDTPSA